jgi:acetolactate synthase-1/2/3 large subunit
VAGAPLDFRLGYGSFGGRHGGPPAKVVHLVDAPGQVAGHVPLAASVAGDLGLVLDGLAEAVAALPGRRPDTGPWRDRLRDQARAAVAGDRELLDSDADPIHPARVYGELLAVPGRRRGRDRRRRRLRLLRRPVRGAGPARAAGSTPGPTAASGTGLGYAIAARLARPSAQVVLLLGDGAAGFSLMDVDTLVRHRLPVVIVCGNNGIWGLEKHPMRMLYGYDVAADLQPRVPLRPGRRGPRGRRRAGHHPAELGRPCAGPSTPASPTWSTWPPTPRSPTPAPPPVFELIGRRRRCRRPAGQGAGRSTGPGPARPPAKGGGWTRCSAGIWCCRFR